MKLKIKRDDEVEVVSGSEKGKKGKVLDIRKKPLKIRVSGVFVQTHFDKKERKKFQKEGYIDYSNVRLFQASEPKKQKRKVQKKKVSR